MKRLLEFFSPDRATAVGFILFLVCVPFFVFCRTHHFCMFGHLQDAVTVWDTVNDWFWRFGFCGSIILGFRSGITFRYVFTFALAVGFLMIASPLNLGGILIFPVTGAACLFALASLAGWID